ncbi:MAG: phosphomannose isomerase type II C-terminal cupin domain [Acidimicrobiales bacterium]
MTSLSAGGKDAEARETSERPWGSYVVLDEEPDHKIKRLVVHPGKRLSLQVHEQRSEHWFVVKGSGVVTLDSTVADVGPGDSVDVEVGTAHRIENTGEVDLVFVEVQHGTYFGEDDIIRLDDDFGRMPTTQ